MQEPLAEIVEVGDLSHLMTLDQLENLNTPQARDRFIMLCGFSPAESQEIVFEDFFRPEQYSDPQDFITPICEICLTQAYNRWPNRVQVMFQPPKS
jgi:hypothetical protein